MKTQQDNRKSNWAEQFVVYTFPDYKQIRVQKKSVKTLGDLKWQLQEHVDIFCNCMDIAIDRSVLCYPDDTLIEDLGINKNDKLFVLAKPYFQDEVQNKLHQSKIQKATKENVKRIQQEDQYFKKRMDFIMNSQKLKSLYKSCLRQWSKVECLIVVSEEGQNEDKVRQVLTKGHAFKKALLEQQTKQKQYIKSLLQTKQFKQIRSKTLDFPHEDPVASYGAIIRKLKEIHPKLRDIQQKHRSELQEYFIGQSYVEKDDYEEISSKGFSEQDQKLIEQIVTKARTNRIKKAERLSRIEIQSYLLEFLGKHDQLILKKILMNSGNNIEAARDAVGKTSVDYLQNLFSLLSEKAQKLTMLHIFSHPDLQEIRKALKGRPQKANNFFKHFLTQQSKKISKIMPNYKQQIVSVLCGVNCLKKNQKQPEPRGFKTLNQLSQAEQTKLRYKVQQNYSKQLLSCFLSQGQNQQLVKQGLRAVSGRLQGLGQCLQLRGIVRQYDFCEKSSAEQQKFIHNILIDQKNLLLKFDHQKDYLQWLTQIKQLRPFLFDMVIRNKPYVDKLIQQAKRTQ